MEAESNSPGHLPLKTPPNKGPAIAEQLQVMLSACDHLALLSISTISAVIVQTALTIPPPPAPAINHHQTAQTKF